MLYAAFIALMLAAAPVGDGCPVPPDPPAYYAIDLVPTRALPGVKLSSGVGYVSFAKSPFGVALSEDGRYVYDLTVSTKGLPSARGGAYAVWVTSPSLDRVDLLGVLDDEGQLAGRVSMNKYLLVVTYETGEVGTAWQGPIVMRGLSRSGLMHTMAGHGPFEEEPCAKYGYY